jgi:hypothetical protein
MPRKTRKPIRFIDDILPPKPDEAVAPEYNSRLSHVLGDLQTPPVEEPLDPKDEPIEQQMVEADVESAVGESADIMIPASELEVVDPNALFEAWLLTPEGWDSTDHRLPSDSYRLVGEITLRMRRAFMAGRLAR